MPHDITSMTHAAFRPWLTPIINCPFFESRVGARWYRLKTLTEAGYGIYTSRDNAVTLCKRYYNLGSLTSF